MNKSDLISRVAEATGHTKKTVESTLVGILEEIKRELVAGEKVSLPGFGNFDVRERKERQGLNPSTGEKMLIPASKNVKFTPGTQLKDAIKNS